MFIHYSQIPDNEKRILPGMPKPGLAQKIAEAHDLEAFLDTETGTWFAFTEDEDSQFIEITQKLCFRFLGL